MISELTAADKYKQLNTAGVADLLGVSKRTVWRYVEQGVLPQPQYIKPKHPRWRMGEVVEVYGSQLTSAENVVESVGVARAQAPKKEVKEKPQSTAEKLKKRFGLS